MLTNICIRLYAHTNGAVDVYVSFRYDRYTNIHMYAVYPFFFPVQATVCLCRTHESRDPLEMHFKKNLKYTAGRTAGAVSRWRGHGRDGKSNMGLVAVRSSAAATVSAARHGVLPCAARTFSSTALAASSSFSSTALVASSSGGGKHI